MIRAEDLIGWLVDYPFKPFRIHLSDQTTFVTEPGMVIVGKATATLPSTWGQDEEGRRVAERFRTISLVHITQFSDVDELLRAES